MEDTIQEEQKNEWLEFDDELSFLTHLNSIEQPEKIVEVYEWKTKVLCRALSTEDRIRIQALSYDKEKKNTDYRRCVFEVIMFGCYNPKTGKRLFRESNKAIIMKDPRNGVAAEELFVVILQLSGMLATTVEQARKN